MKIFRAFAFFAAVLLLALPKLRAQAPDFYQGLVAYYRFDGSLGDSGPFRYNASGAATRYDSDRHNTPSGAAVFSDGTHAVLPQQLVTALAGSGPLTLCAWVKVQDVAAALTRSRNAISFGDAKAGAALTFGLSSQGPGQIEFSHYGTDPVFSLKTVPNDKWVQIAVTVDGTGGATLYLDGAADGTKHTTPNRGNTLGFIGKNIDGHSWEGLIDDVRIYTRAFDAAEIQALYVRERDNVMSPAVAHATAQVVNGFVVGANVVFGGSGYSTPPNVRFVGGGGSGATAVAVVAGGSVTEINVLTTGSGYSSVPEIQIDPPPTPPRRATATATVTNGFVVGINLLDGGAGYTEAPVVELLGGSGAGAKVEATVLAGAVVSLRIVETGSGYTSAPVVLIGRPPSAPELAIVVSRVMVRLSLILGKSYLLESSADLVTWTATGPVFKAEDEEVEMEFVVAETGRYFRVQEVP